MVGLFRGKKKQWEDFSGARMVIMVINSLPKFEKSKTAVKNHKEKY